jgi:hypothetical protein
MRRLKPPVAPDEPFDFYDMDEPVIPVDTGETFSGGGIANEDEIEAEPINYSGTV